MLHPPHLSNIHLLPGAIRRFGRQCHCPGRLRYINRCQGNVCAFNILSQLDDTLLKFLRSQWHTYILLASGLIEKIRETDIVSAIITWLLTSIARISPDLTSMSYPER